MNSAVSPVTVLTAAVSPLNSDDVIFTHANTDTYTVSGALSGLGDGNYYLMGFSMMANLDGTFTYCLYSS